MKQIILKEVCMKIGLDIHGVIEMYPEFFLELARLHLSWGNEIHIITGSSKKEGLAKIRECGFSEDDYSEFFSIVDFHKRNRTTMWKNEKGEWEMDEKIWWGTKAMYWNKIKIDIHYDDSIQYNINNTLTKFVLVKNKIV